MVEGLEWIHLIHNAITLGLIRRHKVNLIKPLDLLVDLGNDVVFRLRCILLLLLNALGGLLRLRIIASTLLGALGNFTFLYSNGLRAHGCLFYILLLLLHL